MTTTTDFRVGDIVSLPHRPAILIKRFDDDNPECVVWKVATGGGFELVYERSLADSQMGENEELA